MNDLNMMLAGHVKRESDGSLGENQRFLENLLVILDCGMFYSMPAYHADMLHLQRMLGEN